MLKSDDATSLFRRISLTGHVARYVMSKSGDAGSSPVMAKRFVIMNLIYICYS